MTPLKCVAVDDEPLALDLVETYVAKVPYLELLARCESAVETLDVIRKQDTDILFLDIQLPDLTGFDLLSAVANPPPVIFTTAYDSYAVRSYAVDAVDYLLKPFSFPRFLRAVQKASALRRLTISECKPIEERHVFLHVDGKDLRIDVDDILLVEGMNEYAIVRTPDKKYIIRESLHSIEVKLAPYGFLRVHKSYIIPLHRTASIDHGVIRIKDGVLPLGIPYRQVVDAAVARLRIG